jgi:nucleoside 2-deoxyribosyltransferase
MSSRCPVCRAQPVEMWASHTHDADEVRCPVCGEYSISRTLRAADVPDDLRPFVSAYIRAANSRGERPTLLTTNIEGLAKQHQGTSVSSKLKRLLRHIADRSKHPGADIVIDSGIDYPLFDAYHPSEISYLLTELVEEGQVHREGDKVRLTPAGWTALEPDRLAGEPNTCFVAMSFRKELDSAYDQGIAPAIRDDCGFEVIRVDRVEHSENINDRIIADLRRAHFVVADFTFHPAGVYFEAGFALGLGRLVVWTCRKNELEKAHFDTRSYNHIVWETPEELRQKLAARVRALVPGAKLS